MFCYVVQVNIGLCLNFYVVFVLFLAQYKILLLLTYYKLKFKLPINYLTHYIIITYIINNPILPISFNPYIISFYFYIHHINYYIHHINYLSLLNTNQLQILIHPQILIKPSLLSIKNPTNKKGTI